MDISPHAHAITAYTARRHVGQHADREHVAASGRAMGSPARPGDARETGQAEQLTPAERREAFESYQHPDDDL